MKFVDPDNLKRTILSSCNQEYIVAQLLSVSEDDVSYCLRHTSNTISNTLRGDDEHPSLGMKYVVDSQTRLPKIRLHDFANPFYRGDIFDIAGIVFRLNPNNKHDFIRICNLLLTIDTQTIDRAKQSIHVAEKTMPTIHVVHREWMMLDKLYWNKAGLQIDYLMQERVNPVLSAILNDKTIYMFDANDPCYSYYYGVCPVYNQHIYKLYFPFRSKGSTRFITNNLYLFEDPLVYNPNLVLLLTKSYKDELAIKYQLINNPDLRDCGVTIKSVNSESVVFRDLDADFIASNYRYVFTNFDFDRTGIKLAYDLKRNYGYIPLFLTNGRFNTKVYRGKDFSGYYELNGNTAANNLLAEAYNTITNTIIKYEQDCNA